MPQVLEKDQTVDIAKALFGSAIAEPPKADRPKSGRKPWIYAFVLVAILAASAAIWRARAGTAAPPYGTAKVTRGTVSKTISATGKVQALTTVQVGTQVSGRVSEISVDFNSKVKKGQVIARVDPSQLQAQLTQTTANLTGAQASEQTGKSAVTAADASVEAAEANLARADSVFADTTRTLERNKMLVSEGVAPKRDLDSSEAAVVQASAQRQQAMAQANQARAQAQSARSQLNQARAQVAQATASVQLASVNLDNTIIRAPIDGTIVSRNVDVGQTVAASLQAPTLFLIANDLTRMQVLADIDEADVGQLAEGTPVTFTVDAYPSDTFTGRVSQVRLSPQILQNVVTYTAVIDVENPDLKLKPGMTANITATVEEQKDALKIPNAALRFSPADAERRRPQPGSGTVYRISGDTLEPVSIRLGLSDGVSTQVLSGGLRDGDRVAIAAAATGANRPTRPASMPGMGAPRGAGRIR